ncbi:hypothetical protein [Desulforhabdus amnigena]|jgi:hypothetical protein|uniref:Uncharacterized protein n=1 Tax=Desulforhabdus amnigena TaxID=40218 RepID=A0A9W6FVS3_9BACT|nr:hypothetical protein [Desulforhabdus amnigena]NLJ26481.1 hypothetical protein [Deltaproteobacteria bacterium]GLI35870.1 hypothetical protein DAMNIGENAA_33030 [Desulforhabdus amnigena]
MKGFPGSAAVEGGATVFNEIMILDKKESFLRDEGSFGKAFAMKIGEWQSETFSFCFYRQIAQIFAD